MSRVEQAQGASPDPAVSTTEEDVVVAAATPAGSKPSGQPKRIRLSLACNQCRKRKVRCDTETPKCRNCWLRDEPCETTDPRYPDGGGRNVRRWATKDGLMPGQNPAATHRNQATVPKNSPASSSTSAVTASVSNRDQRRNSVVGGGTPAARRWSSSASVSVSVDMDATAPINRHPASTTTTSAGGSTAQTTMSWVSRGYQDSVNDGGGGENEGTNCDPDLVVNTDSSAHRVKYMGGSSLQCLAGFVDIYLRRKGLQTMAPGFRSGMRHVEEFQLPLAVIIPQLPSASSVDHYLEVFFRRIWPLFPVVDRASLDADMQYFYLLEQSHPEGLQLVLKSTDIPRLAILMAIIAISADEDADALTSVGETYLTAAYSLYAHLVSMPYLSSVQALTLIAVALRSRAKDGQAWHALGQALRTAHSIGLHRYISNKSSAAEPLSAGLPGYKVDLQLNGRVWWSCYALEKLMEIETGRPSAINDEVIDQVLPGRTASGSAQDAPDYFAHWVSLARILGQISKHLYTQKPGSAWMLLSEIGRLDLQLQEWAASMPEGIKPGHEVFAPSGLNHSPFQQHISSFIILQFYQAQITVLRASLVFPTQSFTDEVKRHGTSLPAYLRLLQSENICTAAARATVRQILELADHDIQSHILSGTQPFLAAVVLALHVLKNPSKRVVRSDLELLVAATEHLEAQFTHAGQHPNFVRGFETLRSSVMAAATMDQRSNSMNKAPGSADSRPDPDLVGNSNTGAGLGDQLLGVPGMMSDTIFFDMADDIPLEELWGSIGSYSFVEPGFDDQPIG